MYFLHQDGRLPTHPSCAESDTGPGGWGIGDVGCKCGMDMCLPFLLKSIAEHGKVQEKTLIDALA